ncbi:hypothetical protein Taro_055158 [Colocasia esculenta]|uniref:Uncharacterized protein n=1 Tax=Colocasia esculenta TaxID=4460 RepID=A0A843XSS9_COLES|nr:hypothetical protein [Colocasia esculenta]
MLLIQSPSILEFHHNLPIVLSFSNQ